MKKLVIVIGITILLTSLGCETKLSETEIIEFRETSQVQMTATPETKQPDLEVTVEARVEEAAEAEASMPVYVPTLYEYEHTIEYLINKVAVYYPERALYHGSRYEDKRGYVHDQIAGMYVAYACLNNETTSYESFKSYLAYLAGFGDPSSSFDILVDQKPIYSLAIKVVAKSYVKQMVAEFERTGLERGCIRAFMYPTSGIEIEMYLLVGLIMASWNEADHLFEGMKAGIYSDVETLDKQKDILSGYILDSYGQDQPYLVSRLESILDERIIWIHLLNEKL